MRTTAIILAAGQGTRMDSQVSKQYLLLHEKPILYYALKAFEDSFVDEVVLVVGKGEIEYCKTNIVEYYGFNKVKNIIEGGKERYLSVYEGLKTISDEDYVFIHDGARPFVNVDILNRIMDSLTSYDSCVVGMPIKDTIKVVDKSKTVINTPDRSTLWMTQTPQAFACDVIIKAYSLLMGSNISNVTDDAMVVELMLNKAVHMVEGDYNNIKITTKEDLVFANAILKNIENNRG